MPTDRKADHLRLSLDPRMQLGERAWDAYRLEHVALPEIALEDVDASTTFLGKPLRAPLLISCMTGGTGDAQEINMHLARGAERFGLALGVGSQRRALEDPELRDTFEVRPFAPTAPILANLGAVQLNYGYGADECARAVEMVGADALVLHLNPLQEAIQPEGDTNFRDLLPRIRSVVDVLDVPVVVKEIGSGLSASVARRLVEEAGVTHLDVAGRGGTSWARIEAARARDAAMHDAFGGWGIPTPEALQAVRQVPGVAHLTASGGIRDGVDAAKALALGADMVGVAQPFLLAAVEDQAEVYFLAERLVEQLRIAMFCTGVRDLAALRKAPICRNADRGTGNAERVR